MGNLHFLELDPANVDNPNAPYAVIPIPYERSVTYGTGTAKAPSAILTASEQIEVFDEEWLQAPHLRVQTLTAVDCQTGKKEQVLDAIQDIASEVMRRKRFLMALGGEHTITAPLVAAAKTVYGSLSVLNLDAHLDLRDQYEGTRLSHACVMRRIMEMDIPITHVGIRSLCEEEYHLVRKHDQGVFWARALIEPTDDSWMNSIIECLGRHVYVTIDSDCLDPSIMPGTGTPEPGGLSWYQVTSLLRRLCSLRTVISADLVEVIPIPGTTVCEYTAARLAVKLMTYHAMAGQKRMVDG